MHEGRPPHELAAQAWTSLVSRTYPLDDINQSTTALEAGEVVRSVMVVSSNHAGGYEHGYNVRL